MTDFVYDDVDLATIKETLDEGLRDLLQYLPDQFHPNAERLILLWESVDRRTVDITDPIDFSGSQWDDYLAAVHGQPSQDDALFNNLVCERINDGTFDSVADVYQIPTGSVLVYRGLAATRREATSGEVVEQEDDGDPQTALAISATNSLMLADIEAALTARAEAKPIVDAANTAWINMRKDRS